MTFHQNLLLFKELVMLDYLSKFLTEEDNVKLIGISEFNGGIYNEEGINVEHAKIFYKHKSFENYPKVRL